MCVCVCVYLCIYIFMYIICIIIYNFGCKYSAEVSPSSGLYSHPSTRLRPILCMTYILYWQ